MSNRTPYLILAAGKVTGATGAGSKCSGATPARTGVGVYTLTLGQEVDSTEAVITANAVGTTDTRVAVEHTSDSVKTIRTFTGAVGTAADADFNFVMAQHSFSS